jgi:hypothetical protein
VNSRATSGLPTSVGEVVDRGVCAYASMTVRNVLHISRPR